MRQPEPILLEDNTRFTQLPLKYPQLQEAFEIHESMFWSFKEIDYSADLSSWKTMTEQEKMFIEHILAFFSGADGIVLENLVKNFCIEVKAPEARNFYGLQAHMENIHAITYARHLDTLVTNVKRKEELFNAIDTIPCVAKKALWAQKWMDSKRLFEERVIAFSIVEGVFFSASFASIFWLKSRNLMTKGLGKSNEFISRDEGLHTDFAVLLYQHLENKVTQERVSEIIKEAVDIEIEFITESISCEMIGMNVNLMKDYVMYVADRLIQQLGFEPIFLKQNPFDFMKSFSLDDKANFFENRPNSYVHSSTAKATAESWDFGDTA
jgi:ribonucleotide reductase beta subunit family protein with ferritin-like domain